MDILRRLLYGGDKGGSQDVANLLLLTKAQTKDVIQRSRRQHSDSLGLEEKLE